MNNAMTVCMSYIHTYIHSFRSGWVGQEAGRWTESLWTLNARSGK